MSGFSKQQADHLAMMLDPANVSTRDGMSYIEQWWAIMMANKIFGFDGWSRETVETKPIYDEPRKLSSGDGFHVGYSAKVRVTVYAGERVIVREGSGFGEGIGKNRPQQHESAIKEAESDAMKRALITFGNQFGLALYDKKKEFVGRAPAANTNVEPKADTDEGPSAELEKLLGELTGKEWTVSTLDEWAKTPATQEAIKALIEPEHKRFRSQYAHTLMSLKQPVAAE
ncbi:MAG: RAD52 family DNA repair protein [Pseudomonadota bacterium]